MLQKVLQEYVEGYRRKSPDTLADLYSQEASLTDPMAKALIPGSDGNVRGRNEIADYYRAIFRNVPHNPVPSVVELILARPHLVVEMTIDRAKTAHILEIRNDRIVTHRIYMGSLPNKYLLDRLMRLD